MIVTGPAYSAVVETSVLVMMKVGMRGLGSAFGCVGVGIMFL